MSKPEVPQVRLDTGSVGEHLTIPEQAPQPAEQGPKRTEVTITNSARHIGGRGLPEVGERGGDEITFTREDH